MNLVYDLPFGKGKISQRMPNAPWILLIGGWQISGTTNVSTGLPWTARFTNCYNEQDVGVCMPNKGSGSFHAGTGSSRPDDAHYVQFFTPVPDITDPLSPAGPSPIPEPATSATSAATRSVGLACSRRTCRCTKASI